MIHSKASGELIKFAEKFSIPVVTTMMGTGAYPQFGKCYIGMIGIFGQKSANKILRNSDLIISLGARFNDRISCCFSENDLSGKIIQIDINQNEIIKQEYSKFHNNYDFIEIHYTLIDNVNDSEDELNLLYDLLSIYKIPIKFINFNPKDDLKKSSNLNNINYRDLKKSSKEDLWIKKLSEIKGLIVKKYSPPGKEVGSSCGEFTKHYYHEEIETEEEYEEFQKWKKAHEIKY